MLRASALFLIVIAMSGCHALHIVDTVEPLEVCDWTCAALSKDATRALGGRANGKVELRDTSSGALILGMSAGQSPIVSVALCPDMDHALASDMRGVFALYDLTRSEPLKTFTFDGKRGGTVAFTPDARHALLSTDVADPAWVDLSTLKVLRPPRGPVEVPSGAVATSPDGKYTVTVDTGADSRDIRLLDRKTGEELDRITPGKEEILAIQFGPGTHSLRAITKRGALISLTLNRD